MKKQQIIVIDGQGGKVGKQLIEGIRAYCPGAEIAAVGTNSMATAAMMKAGATFGATGENAVLVACRTADIIVGPLGIVIADSMHGEITPAMAVGVGQCSAPKVLLPINRCEHLVVGVPDLSMATLLEQAIQAVVDLANELCG